MSDYDFDALRDPEPPLPSAGQRSAVDARARTLRARSRMHRLALSSVSVVAVLALVVGIVASQRDDGPKVIVEGVPTTTRASSIADRFVPPTTVDDGVVTLPVTLPDGATTTMRYPAGLRIAQLGFAGTTGVNWASCCSKQVSVTYQTIADVFGDATPVHVYAGPNGEAVPYFHASQALKNVVPELDFLVFQFGPWLVQVYDVPDTFNSEPRMTDTQRETWARSLTGTVDANGYLLLHAAAPLSLGHEFEGAFGVSPGNDVELGAHTSCGQPESDTSTHRRFADEGGAGVAWCAGDLHVAASGTPRFVNGADQSLQVSPLTPALNTPPVETTTTTTTPAPPDSIAVSASFVSPEHGWVLEEDGTVDETTDGGATWQEVGALGPDIQRIRFADSEHGFAFDNTDYGTEAGVWATDDAGVTWRRLSTPFPDPLELAISRGTVYLVALEGNTFRIWSSVADNLNWTEDPLVLRPTAAPVVSFEFAFGGERGWLVEDSRGAAAGAELTPSGRWISWTPPCTDTGGGSIRVASMSSQDLVASCSEGVWTGPRVTNGFYASHDSGEGFQRAEAPAAGPVSSPTAGIAVIGDAQKLWRTTDDGQHWTVVARVPGPNAYADEVGFTTSMQGFALFRDGTMLMTYDAGATWQPVTLP